MQPQSSTVEERIARIASRGHGVVARRELLAAGLTREQIRRRVRKGLLIPQFRGVYRVGHRAPSAHARYMAAVKACGDRAALSGLAAAHLLGLVRRAPSLPEVTSPGARRIRGIRTRRSRRFERVRFDGIPVTSVARTLVDIAGRLDREQLARAVHEAQVRHRVRPEHMEAVLERHPNAPGAGGLRRILRGDTHVTLSALERTFLRTLSAAGLPLPEHVNKPAGGRCVDCRWPEQRLTVELDSFGFHNSRHSWEQDRLREREAYARGDQHRRYTYGDVFERPERMLAELRGLLAPTPSRRGSGTPRGSRRAARRPARPSP